MTTLLAIRIHPVKDEPAVVLEEVGVGPDGLDGDRRKKAAVHLVAAADADRVRANLVLDLPPYQRPTLRVTLAVTWTRLQGFLRTAGGLIVATVTVVWLLQSIPMPGAGSFGDVDTEHSVYGALAQGLAGLFAPAGFAQWQSVSALVVGFVAKEAVISSWAQTYAVSDPVDGGSVAALGDHIQAAFTASSGGHPVAAVLAFMIFLLAYTPCVATLAAQRREIGVRWTVFGIALQLTIAWVLAVATFQIGRLFL